MKKAAKTVEDYLRRPYTIQLRRYDDGTFFAEVVELPGCMTEADTAEEVLEMIRDAQRGWIEACLEDGTPIPEPAAESAYSGRFLVRAPKTLHRDLAQRARAEGAMWQSLTGRLGKAAMLTCRERVEAEEWLDQPGRPGAEVIASLCDLEVPPPALLCLCQRRSSGPFLRGRVSRLYSGTPAHSVPGKCNAARSRKASGTQRCCSSPK